MSVDINIYDFMKECIGLDLKEIEEYMTFDYKHLSEMNEKPKCNMSYMEFINLCKDMDLEKLEGTVQATEIVIAANKHHADIIGAFITLYMTKIIKIFDDKLRYIAKKRSKLFKKKTTFIEKIDIDNMTMTIGGNSDLETLMVSILGNSEREIDLSEDRKVFTTVNEFAKKMYIMTNIKYLLIKEEKEMIMVDAMNKEIEDLMYNRRLFMLNEMNLKEAENLQFAFATVNHFENSKEDYIKFIKDKAVGKELNEEEINKWLKSVENIKEQRLGNKLKPKLKVLEKQFNKLKNRRK